MVGLNTFNNPSSDEVEDAPVGVGGTTLGATPPLAIVIVFWLWALGSVVPG